jgi:hypothetical protein
VSEEARSRKLPGTRPEPFCLRVVEWVRGRKVCNKVRQWLSERRACDTAQPAAVEVSKQCVDEATRHARAIGSAANKHYGPKKRA